MNESNALPQSPSESLRLDVCKRPPQSAIMYQQWRKLLFLHWQFPVDEIQATLPQGLFVDTYGGKAYLGIVPFFMKNIRPRFLPAVPGISNFMELNLRTYVYDRAGIPGVWFYSLDANQWLAVKIAKTLFHLPYEHAAMKYSTTATGSNRFASQRKTTSASPINCVYDFTTGSDMPQPLIGSLEFFLTERYRLYSNAPDGLRRGSVFHKPYPLCQVELSAWDENLFLLNGFAPTKRPPDHVAFSQGVDVSIFPLERLESPRVQ